MNLDPKSSSLHYVLLILKPISALYFLVSMFPCTENSKKVNFYHQGVAIPLSSLSFITTTLQSQAHCKDPDPQLLHLLNGYNSQLAPSTVASNKEECIFLSQDCPRPAGLPAGRQSQQSFKCSPGQAAQPTMASSKELPPKINRANSS